MNASYRASILIGSLTSCGHAIFDPCRHQWLEEQLVNYNTGPWKQESAINQLRYLALQSLKEGRIEKTFRDSLICTDQQGTNYYHFLIDILPKVLLLRAIANKTGFQYQNVLLSDLPDYAKQYLELCGIKQSIAAKIRTEGPLDHYIFSAENCLILQSHAHKIKIEKSVQLIKRSIRIFQSSKNFMMPKKIFIERRDGNNRCKHRKVYPQHEFHKWLAKIGFSIVYLEDLEVKQQIELFQNAEVISGVHGAGLANIIFCKKRVQIVEIQHEKGCKPFFIDLAHSIGLNNYNICKLPGFLSEEEEEKLWHPEILYNQCPLLFKETLLATLKRISS